MDGELGIIRNLKIGDVLLCLRQDRPLFTKGKLYPILNENILKNGLEALIEYDIGKKVRYCIFKDEFIKITKQIKPEQLVAFRLTGNIKHIKNP